MTSSVGPSPVLGNFLEKIPPRQEKNPQKELRDILESNETERLKAFLSDEKNKNAVNEMYQWKLPLAYAVTRCSPEMVKILIEKGKAQVNQQNPFNNKTALMQACQQCSEEMVCLLVYDFTADVDLVCSDNKKAFEYIPVDKNTFQNWYHEYLNKPHSLEDQIALQNGWVLVEKS